MASDPKPVRLVKKSQSAGTEPPVEDVVAEQPNDWSKAIHSWIKEFRGQHRPRSFPAFDSLFKEELETEPELAVDNGSFGAEAE